jgi:AraC-like DNA-binding protein
MPCHQNAEAGNRDVMPGSLTSVFGDPEAFEAALRAENIRKLLVIAQGQFRARLVEVALHRLRLAAAEEMLARIAFVAVPADAVLVVLPPAGGPAPVWGGRIAGTGEIVTIAPGERLHARARGACRWGLIEVRAADLADYGRSLRGAAFVVPSGVAGWRPQAAALAELQDLHRAAIRHAGAGAAALADGGAAHGLEQQLLHAVIGCLSAAPAAETPAARRHRELLAGFEDLLDAGSVERVGDIAAALGVSERLLRQCCAACLGMSPAAYRRRRRMQEVRRALRRGDGAATVAAIAARHGFRDPGRFGGIYRALYGELPSATLRRSDAAAFLLRRRPRVKVS